VKVDCNDVAAVQGPDGLADVINGKLSDGWPKPMSEAAYHGLTGEIVRAIEPHCEADPHGILLQHLVFFGNIIGRGAHWRVGGTKHYGNLFAVIVGDTAKGRKGTGSNEVRRIYEHVGDWTTERIKNGCSSSEGIIHQVRDPGESRGDKKPDDQGVDDKRLMLMEQEFANVLQQGERNGNTLSARLREAWENGNLETLTRNNPLKATGAHISIVGHITKDELLRRLNSTEVANGLANRFLWASVRRSKLLPDGGSLGDMEVEYMRDKLKKAVEFASEPRLLTRDNATAELWRHVYGELTADGSGMAAVVCGRAEAQAMRLATLYALLDHAEEIRIEHLQAGLAVWRYCEDSAKYIFGDSIGDPTADTIMASLKTAADGLTRTDLSDIFGRNRKSSDIDRALGVLQRSGRAHCKMMTESRGGRSAETWFIGKS